MLQIFVDNKPLDLLEDTEVSLTFENPIRTDSATPTPYSLTYDLPLTDNNRKILGYPDRATSINGFTARPAEIVFNGITLATGEQTIDEVSDVISANFNATVLPKDIRKGIQTQPVGTLDLGQAWREENGRINVNSPLARYSEILVDSANIGNNVVVAPTIAIKGGDMPEKLENSNQQQQANFINAYHVAYGYTNNWLGGTLSAFRNFSSILLSMRVNKLMDTLLGGRLANNPFNEIGLDKIVLVGLWHPRYRGRGRQIDVDENTLAATVNINDFLPAVSGNTLINELLKIPCASMFLRGGSYVVEYNRNIMDRDVMHDWSNKIVGSPTISLEKGKDYICGFSDSDTSTNDDEYLSYIKVSSIKSMFDDVKVSSTIGNGAKYYVTSTKQLFEVTDDITLQGGYCFTLLEQAAGGISKTSDDSQDDERQVFDNTFNGEVVQTSLRRYWLNDHSADDAGSEFNRYIYVPEVPTIDKKRSDKITIGLFHGMQKDLVIGLPSASRRNYPCVSHSSVDVDGNTISPVSLCFDNETSGLMKYHADFKQWIERDKRVLKANILLSPAEISRLDLRDKYYINGVIYYISNITINIYAQRIAPAEAEFIEAV